MGTERDIENLAEELTLRFGMERELARKVAAFIEARLKRDNDRYNAFLLSRVMMRLAESDGTKVVAASLAVAADMLPVYVGGRACKTKADVARQLSVKSGRFSAAVDRSKEFLGLGRVSPRSVLDQTRPMTACEWRN